MNIRDPLPWELAANVDQGQLERGYRIQIEENSAARTLCCGYCDCIPWYPFQTQCGHFVCAPCFSKWHSRNGEPQYMIPCTRCEEQIHVKKLIPYEGFKEGLKLMYRNLSIPCRWQCGFANDPYELHKHEIFSCIKRPVACPNPLCKKVLSYEDLTTNHYFTCTEYRIYCHRCHLSFKPDEQDSHNCIDALMKTLNSAIVLLQLNKINIPEDLKTGPGGTAHFVMPPNKVGISRALVQALERRGAVHNLGQSADEDFISHIQLDLE